MKRAGVPLLILALRIDGHRADGLQGTLENLKAGGTGTMLNAALRDFERWTGCCLSLRTLEKFDRAVKGQRMLPERLAAQEQAASHDWRRLDSQLPLRGKICSVIRLALAWSGNHPDSGCGRKLN